MITVLAIHLAIFIVCSFAFYDRVHSANITNKQASLCARKLQPQGTSDKSFVSTCNRYLHKRRTTGLGLRFTLFVVMICTIICLLFQLGTAYFVFWCIKQCLYLMAVLGSLWFAKLKVEKQTVCDHSTEGSNLLLKFLKKTWCVVWCELCPTFIYSVDIKNITETQRGSLLNNIIKGEDPRRNPFTAFSVTRIMMFNIYNCLFASILYLIALVLTHSTNVSGHTLLVRIACLLFGGTNFWLTFIGTPR